MWKWLSGLFKEKRKPSEYIRLHLSGQGSGYELDDMVSWHANEPGWEDVNQEILAISNRFATSEHPIGISNPACALQLQALAARLEAEGR